MEVKQFSYALYREHEISMTVSGSLPPFDLSLHLAPRIVHEFQGRPIGDLQSRSGTLLLRA